jgi:hypothetical protein
MIEIASPATPQLSSLLPLSFDRAGGARPTMLRAPLANTAATKNMIPLPTENTPSLCSILRNHL